MSDAKHEAGLVSALESITTLGGEFKSYLSAALSVEELRRRAALLGHAKMIAGKALEAHGPGGRVAGLVKAAEEVAWLVKSPEENSSDHLDRLAERFSSETGVMAPFKDAPAAMCGSSSTHEERMDEYRRWYQAFGLRLRDALAAFPDGES